MVEARILSVQEQSSAQQAACQDIQDGAGKVVNERPVCTESGGSAQAEAGGECPAEGQEEPLQASCECVMHEVISAVVLGRGIRV